MIRTFTTASRCRLLLFLAHLLALATLLPDTSAAAPVAADSIPPTAATADQTAAERQRRFNEYYLEAIRQKEKEAYDAEYELLRAALRLCPDAPEALYEMGLLRLSFAGTADTLARAEGDSLLRRAVQLDPENLQYKELLANHLARSGD